MVARLSTAQPMAAPVAPDAAMVPAAVAAVPVAVAPRSGGDTAATTARARLRQRGGEKRHGRRDRRDEFDRHRLHVELLGTAGGARLSRKRHFAPAPFDPQGLDG